MSTSLATAIAEFLDECGTPYPGWPFPHHRNYRIDEILKERRDPPPIPWAVVVAARGYLATARHLEVAEPGRGAEMVRALATSEGFERFARVNGLTGLPRGDGSDEHIGGRRWWVRDEVARALFDAGLAAEGDFASVLRGAAYEVAGFRQA